MLVITIALSLLAAFWFLVWKYTAPERKYYPKTGVSSTRIPLLVDAKLSKDIVKSESISEL